MQSRLNIRLLACVMLGLFGAYALLYYYFQLGQLRTSGDFFALWSYGQILREHGAAALYDPDRLHALQVALGMDAADHNPFPYPPSFLLLVWPLGLAPFGPAFAGWTGLTLAAFVAAVTAPRFRTAPVAVALLAPGTTIAVIAGQSGFLSGALLIGGMRLVNRRPWLAGVLIGLLTFKPQLGLLIPVALVAAGAWRTVAAAAMTVAALFAVTCLLFGAEIWSTWLAALSGYSEYFAAKSVRYNMMPTVLANLMMLDVPRAVANAVQALVGCTMAAATWIAFRRGVTPGAVAVLAAGTFLTTPHAFVYDLPMATGAALLFLDARLRDGAAPRLPETAALALALCFPALMLWSPQLPLSSVALLSLVALGLARPGSAAQKSCRTARAGAT